MFTKKIIIFTLIFLKSQDFSYCRAINSSVIMDLWSRNINWSELMDNNGPKEFTIENEKITVKLEHQLTAKENQRVQGNNKELLSDVEVFRESKESSRELGISEVIYKGNGWEIIIKNPNFNSCF